MHMRHFLVVLLAVMVLALPALADEPSPEDPGGHAAGAHEERDLIQPAWQEIAVSIGTFLILLLILTKFAWKPILNGLQAREATIKKALDDAQKANEEALALLASYQERMEGAKAEAQGIADKARKDADLARQRIEEDARKRAEETLERSLKEIEQAKDTALDEILTEVGSIATEAASRIVRREITAEDNAKIVDDVVKDFASSREGSGA